MERSSTSHKGENGTVAIIGGSRHQHGAPLFSALAAEASGVDLIHLFVPTMHEEVSKTASLNFQVRTFGSRENDEISPADRTHIVEFLATIDVLVIGPGLARTQKSVASVFELLDEIPCPVVVDATALQPETLSHISGRGAVLTPHLGELERMNIERNDLSSLAKKHQCTMLLKGHQDIVVDTLGRENIIEGGNPGLTVGGTGDALAGLVAGLIAQKMHPGEACSMASTIIKRSGDLLMQVKGYAYTTRDVIAKIPSLLAKFRTS